MKRTVFIFHGTGGHPGENWFPWLKRELEEHGEEVIIPAFPNPEAPRPTTWYPVLESIVQTVTPDSILIGHSLGCVIALRLLERLSQSVHQTVLVAPPLGIPPIKFIEGDSPFLEEGFSWERIRSNAGQCTVFHSDNDPFVSIENGRECARKLGVELTFVLNAGHFNAAAGYTEFPLLLQRILDEL